jgi:hypothetical protein
MKLRYLLLIFLFALLAGTWTARTQLAEFAFSPVMQSFGLSDVNTDIAQLDPSQSRLSSLAFTLADGNGLFRLEAYDINISYNLKQLKEGHIDSVTINRLVLYHEKNLNSADDTSISHDDAAHKILQPIQVVAAVRQALRDYIIFNSFSVQQITMHGETFSMLQDKPLRLHSINDNGALYAEISLLDQPPSGQQDNLRQLVITRLSPDSISAELRFSATAKSLAASIELFIHDKDKINKDAIDTEADQKVISGNYHIVPLQLQDWLQPFAEVHSIGEIEKLDGTLSFSFEPDEHIVATVTAASDRLKLNAYQADNFFLKLKTIHSAANPLQRIQVQNGSFIKVSNCTLENISLAPSQLFIIGDLSGANENWQYKGGLRLEALDISYPPQKLQLKELAASISATAENMSVKGNFSPLTVPGKFSFMIDHNFGTGHGRLTIDPKQAIDLTAENNRLSQLVTPWSYPFDLLSGHIKLTSQATWSPEKDFSLTTKINLEDGGGTLANEIIFSGLSFDHELELLPQLHSIRAGNIELRHLDSGVTSSNISTSLTLKTAKTGLLPRFVVLDLHGEILGGTFSADDFAFDLNKNKNHFRIKANNIDLAEIVKTQQLESIEVTGRVDGTIPVEINEQGLFIEHGGLVNAVRAGTIRYNPSAVSDQLRENPLTGIALDALKDFRYSHLSADVNYTPEGILTVNLQLQGTSPELDTDRPVHLNINTEQNLITLLKSLRFSQGISDNIDKNVRHQYEKSRNKI